MLICYFTIVPINIFSFIYLGQLALIIDDLIKLMEALMLYYTNLTKKPIFLTQVSNMSITCINFTWVVHFMGCIHNYPYHVPFPYWYGNYSFFTISHRSSKADRWAGWCYSSDRLRQSALSQLLLGLPSNNVVLVPEWDQVRLKAYIEIFTLPIIHMSSSVLGIVWMVI